MDATEFAGNQKWFRAQDLIAKKINRTVGRIAEVDTGEFRDQATGEIKRQLVLQFHGWSKMFGLNVTNTQMMISLYGPDTDGWIGKQIGIKLDKTKSKTGGVVDCLRIEHELPVKQIEQAPAGNGGLGASLKKLGDAVPRQFVTEAHAKHDTSTTAPVSGLDDAGDEIPF